MEADDGIDVMLGMLTVVGSEFESEGGDSLSNDESPSCSSGSFVSSLSWCVCAWLDCCSWMRRCLLLSINALAKKTVVSSNTWKVRGGGYMNILSQIIRPREWSVTVRAKVGAFLGVRPHVSKRRASSQRLEY